MTINVIQKKAVLHLYAVTTATAEDPVGFGKCSSQNYREVQQNHPSYASWVIQTYQEDPEHDPRLGRLAKWLMANQEEKTKDTAMNKQDPGSSSQKSYTTAEMERMGYQFKKKNRGGATKSSSTSSDDSWTPVDVISQLTATIENLKQEIQEMKEERTPRRKKMTPENQTSP